jgi:hypothetical protein
MTLQHLLLAGAMALAVLPAGAQQAAATTVGNLRYQLIDLAPNDGIAPWIGVNSYATLVHAQVYDRIGNEIAGAAIEHLGSAGFDNDYASLHADAQEDGAHAQLTLYSGWGYAGANRSFRFLMSPNTQVVFSVDADLWASPEAPGLSWPTAIAQLYGSLHGSLHGIDDDQGFDSIFHLEDGAQHGTLSVMATTQDDWAEGYLAYEAYAVAESHALPVPEPETSAMLLGGMVMLALAGRLRRSK